MKRGSAVTETVLTVILVIASIIIVTWILRNQSDSEGQDTSRINLDMLLEGINLACSMDTLEYEMVLLKFPGTLEVADDQICIRETAKQCRKTRCDATAPFTHSLENGLTVKIVKGVGGYQLVI